MHIEHRIRTRDGRTLAVAEWGDPNGVPLFALHGTPGSRVAFWHDPTIYTRHGLRRITLDRPGYGESTRQPGRSVVDIVPDILAIAGALGIGFFAITGGSGGGPHALACAALHRSTPPDSTGWQARRRATSRSSRLRCAGRTRSAR